MGSRKRRRTEAFHSDRMIRKTRSLSEMPCTNTQSETTESETTIQTNADASLQTVEVVSEEETEKEVFAGAEEQATSGHIEPIERTEVGVEEEELIKIDRESSQPDLVNILTQEIIVDAAETTTADDGLDREREFEMTVENDTSLPIVLDLSTPEVKETLVEASINKTMEQYNETVLDDCTHCRELEVAVKRVLNEVQEKDDAMVELLEEQQLLLKKSDELQLHNEKLENVLMHTASRMRQMKERKKLWRSWRCMSMN